jgi:tRNA A-37 threonylcarbamoyl transferase component Bud32
MLAGTSYQVVREIGAGGMGIVYEIEHVRLKKRYVAKVIHDQIENDESAAKRIEREAQVLATISHPNVVQVHDVGTTPDGVSYFVMEKLEGVDLRHTMKKHGVPRTRAIEIVSEVLDALEYVHRRGIVHRDIKPENIFLANQPHGTVTKVLDFGIVHVFDSDGHISQGRITKTGGFVGTFYYAAPEQLQGKPAGPPNDVYAAGLVLFELLAGKGPFDDDPGVGLSRCFKAAPLLTEFVPTAPPELSEVVASALEQDPTRRPTAGSLAAKLRKVGAALTAAPGAADDDAVRVEVDDLLRHMAPVAPPRPAAGRLATDERSDSSAPAGVAVRATAAPATPVFAGAPGYDSADVRPSIEATMASPMGDVPPATRQAAGEPDGAPDTQARVEAVHRATMLGPGRALQHIASPDADESVAAPATPMMHLAASPAPGAAQPAAVLQAPARISWPGAPNDPGAGSGHSVSSPPPSPRFPPAPSPTGSHPSAQHAQLFASVMPVHPARSNSAMPRASATSGEASTSPGVYATIDNQSIPSTRLPAQTPWTTIVGVGAAALLALLLLGGTIAYRQHGSTPTSGSGVTTATTIVATTAEPPAPSTATPPPSAERVTATTDSAPAPTMAASSRPASIATASAMVTTKGGRAAGIAPTAATPTRPVTPSTPRSATSAKSVETDGYVKSL